MNQLPSIGRIVIYSYPSYWKKQPLPAIIVGTIEESNKLNLSVHTQNDKNPVVVKLKVPHKSSATEGGEYWDWPEIKR